MTRPVVPVKVDPIRGHITCGEIVFADVGSTLSVWSHQGASLDVDVARQLGQALLNWAAEKAISESVQPSLDFGGAA